MAESWDTKKGCQVTGSFLTQVYECNEAEAYCAMRQAGESWRKVEQKHTLEVLNSELRAYFLTVLT